MKRFLMMVLIAMMVTGGATAVLAASARCVVVKAEGQELVLECERGTDDFQPGQEVKLKVERTEAAIEGC
ncbi:MAG: hypothetical protein IH612_01275 [Desulfofustis sp.]|nr:hypothetical protein [Desulfofustis sp.]